MRAYAILFILALLNTSVSAITVFDNGTTLDPTNVTWNATNPTYTIFDDFVLTSDTTITDINYSMFTKAGSYDKTYVSILDGFGGSLLSSFTLAGNITSNGAVSGNSVVPSGFDINLNGLSLDLLAGNYVLGLSVGVLNSGTASIGSGDSGYGSSLIQSAGSTNYFRNEHLAFSFEGTQAPSTVPVPAAAWLFGSALLGFFGFSRRKATT